MGAPQARDLRPWAFSPRTAVVRVRVPSPIPFLPDETEQVLKPARLSIYLTVATVAAVAVWYLAHPGPQILPQLGDGSGEITRDFDTGLHHVLWTLALYVGLPALAMLALRDSLRDAGLAIGDAAYGIKAMLIVSALALPALYMAADDPSIQATYPWAGAWPGASPGNLVTWLGLLLVFTFSFEFFFRGFLMQALRPHVGVGAAIWFQAIAATMVHLGKPLPETIAALPASLLFGLMAVRSRSIVYNVLLHLAVAGGTDVFSLVRQGLLFP